MILSDSELREDAIDDDIAFRRDLHFPSSRDYVESLYDDTDLTVGSRAAGLLMTPEEFEEFAIRSRLTLDSAIVHAYYLENPEARDGFGGIEIDHEVGGAFVVYLTQGAPAPWRDDIPHEARLEIRRVDRSLDALEEIRGLVDAAWEADDPATVGLTLTAICIETGRVVVGFAPESLAGLESGEVPASFAAEFGRADFVAKPHTRPAGVAWIRGGLGYDHDGETGNADCSFGFTAVKEDPPDPDDDFILAAGHCGEDRMWENVDRNGDNVGPFVENLWSDYANGDWALIRVDDDYTFEAAPTVKHFSYALDVKALVDTHDEGTPRCFTGLHGTQCGIIDVDGENVTVEYTCGGCSETNHIKHLVIVTKDPIPGDSGGVTYWHNTTNNTVKAAGGIVARNTIEDVGYYTKVDWIPAAWEASVKLLSGSSGCSPISTCPTP